MVRCSATRCNSRCDVQSVGATYLLHDSGLALRESDMATRLVLDKLDLDLPPLATGLVIIVVVVVGSAGTLTLDAAVLHLEAVAISDVVVAWRRVAVVLGDFGGHCWQFCRIEL